MLQRSNDKLVRYFRKEWLRLYGRNASTLARNLPPKTTKSLTDIHGIPVAKSLLILAKCITQYALTHGTNIAVTALKTGLNYLPTQFGCAAPSLKVSPTLDYKTKKILVKNLALRGRHQIEEALALGHITHAINQSKNPIDKENIHNLIGNILTPLYLDRKNNDKAIWVLSLAHLLNTEFTNHQEHPVTIKIPSPNLTAKMVTQLNQLIQSKGSKYFVQRLAESMDFFIP